MAETFQFELNKPEGVVLKLDNAEEAIIPGSRGLFGVRKGHHPFLTLLGAGALRVHTPDEEHHVMVSDGYCEVTGDRVVVLAETAERSEEIDVARAERARDRANETIKDAASSADALEKAHASLQRAEARLKVAKKAG